MLKHLKLSSLSIAKTVILLLIIILTLVLTGLGTFNYIDKKKSSLEDLNQLGNHAVKRFQQNLPDPLWNIAYDQVSNVIKSEMENQNFFAVLVYEADGENIAQAKIRNNDWELVDYDQEKELSRQKYIFSKGKIEKDGELLGIVEIYLTTRFVHQELEKLLFWTIIIVATIDALLIILLFIFLRVILLKPIKKLETFALQIGEGQLETSKPSGLFIGELGSLNQALIQMVENLKQTIIEVQNKQDQARELAQKAENSRKEAETAKEDAIQSRKKGMVQAAYRLENIVDRITNSSNQLFSQVQVVQEGTDQQKERISDTASSMEEMNATVLEVAKNAGNAAEEAQHTQGMAENGSQVVSEVVRSIEQVNSKADVLRQNMDELGKQAKDIGQVITVIEDIADQTNLLALNAAIEAARAGDAGRGFAVVADEVRKLAEKTMSATKEVSTSIQGIQKRTTTSLNITEEVTEAVKDSTQQAERSGESLTQIVELAQNTSDQVRLIATASEQQSATSEEINNSVEEINNIAAETAEGMASASQEIADLSELSADLNKVIEELKSD